MKRARYLRRGYTQRGAAAVIVRLGITPALTR
jgi:hypothetical protein